ncbi:hypothetical protein G7Y89_g836 [Cudoniella acicularis]|uniref:Uncharacterized protein n=1 Tax=Cudoniella acicularis TaxID=354080 RepID=A0A8H4RXH1_9HELO|nr:hypothetical protein G7Y89_g836 [Cudoniella acicularis]
MGSITSALYRQFDQLSNERLFGRTYSEHTRYGMYCLCRAGTVGCETPDYILSSVEFEYCQTNEDNEHHNDSKSTYWLKIKSLIDKVCPGEAEDLTLLANEINEQNGDPTRSMTHLSTYLKAFAAPEITSGAAIWHILFMYSKYQQIKERELLGKSPIPRHIDNHIHEEISFKVFRHIRESWHTHYQILLRMIFEAAGYYPYLSYRNVNDTLYCWVGLLRLERLISATYYKNLEESSKIAFESIRSPVNIQRFLGLVKRDLLDYTYSLTEWNNDKIAIHKKYFNPEDFLNFRKTKHSDPNIKKDLVASVEAYERTFQRECEVCLERRALEIIAQSRITSTCNHEPNVCLECLTRGLRRKP